MQKSPGENQPGSANRRGGKIAFYTFLCFSLAGLIAGFAFGGFAGRSPGSSNTGSGPTTKTSATGGHGSNPSAITAPENVFLGDPLVRAGDYTSPEKADGTSSYTFSAQIVNKNPITPITATDVTCRLWLTDDANATAAALSANSYAIPRTIASFSQPFPHEIAGALNFTSPSQQTQPCVANGKTTWTYTVSPTVQQGDYFLTVLADWKGTHYNWYMVAVRVPKGDNGGH